MSHIRNPTAYANAIEARIKANAWKTKRADFQRDEPELWAVLSDLWIPEWDPDREEWQADGSHMILKTMTNKERTSLLRSMSWLQDGFEKYGSLTEKQIEKAKEIVAEVKAKVARFEDEDERRKLGATPWENGRQEFPCTIVSMTLKDVPKWSYYDSGTAWKMIVQNESGARLYCTAPSKVLDAAFARAESEWDETKVQRGARGMKLVLRVNVERANDDPIFAFGKRPHVVSIEEVS